MTKYTIKKVGGDDAYSWALLEYGRPILTGMTRTEAQHERDSHREKEEEKNGRR